VRTQRYRPVLFFSGGEPFMRKDFIDILSVVKKNKFICGINTNGYMLDNKRIKKLINLGIDLIIFSLYGTEEIHDAVTGVKGSYAKTTENIRQFCMNRSKKNKVIISCSINKINVDFLDSIPLIAQKLGVNAVKFEHLNFLSNAEFKKNSSHFSSDINRIHTFLTEFNEPIGLLAKKIIDKLSYIRKRYRNFIFIKPDLSDTEIMDWYSDSFQTKRKCFFVWHSVFIKPDGVVVPCQFLLDYELGNIKEHNLEHIFQSEKMLNLRKLLRKQLLPECFRCCKL